VNPEKKPGTIRVICLGDSITAQGHPGYSQYLQDRLTQRPPTPQLWEAFNMGVHGYSSMQGLKLLQTRVLTLKPDIVTIWYGWNDHWMCDKTDRATMAIETGAFSGPILEALHRKRVYMLLAWMINSSRHSWRKNTERPFRVPPKEYRAALEQMVHEARDAGAVPLLIAGPRRNLTESLVSKGFAHSPAGAQQIHDRYVTITREVARDTQAELLDLAALFAGPECDSYFAADGIHFDQYGDEGTIANDPRSQPGLQRVAAELDAKIREIVQSREWQALHITQP
jgi:lysophospholipase L1-like esterase